MNLLSITLKVTLHLVCLIDPDYASVMMYFFVSFILQNLYGALPVFLMDSPLSPSLQH